MCLSVQSLVSLVSLPLPRLQRREPLPLKRREKEARRSSTLRACIYMCGRTYICMCIYIKRTGAAGKKREGERVRGGRRTGKKEREEEEAVATSECSFQGIAVIFFPASRERGQKEREFSKGNDLRYISKGVFAGGKAGETPCAARYPAGPFRARVCPRKKRERTSSLSLTLPYSPPG